MSRLISLLFAKYFCWVQYYLTWFALCIRKQFGLKFLKVRRPRCFKLPNLLLCKCGYVWCQVRVSDLEHNIDIFAFDPTLFVIAQISFCLCRFWLGKLIDGLVKICRRVFSHNCSATHTCYHDCALGEINDFSIFLHCISWTHSLHMISTKFISVSINFSCTSLAGARVENHPSSSSFWTHLTFFTIGVSHGKLPYSRWHVVLLL